MILDFSWPEYCSCIWGMAPGSVKNVSQAKIIVAIRVAVFREIKEMMVMSSVELVGNSYTIVEASRGTVTN